MGVHGADIKGAPAQHTEEEPQDSNDPRWALRRQARQCQRCGHRAAQERESGVRTAEPGDSVTGPPAPFPGRRLRRVLVVMVRRLPRPELARDGPRVALLHEGRDPLAKGCAYCTKAPPTQSAPNPPPVAPHPRAVRPDDAGSHQRDRVSLLRQAEAAALPSLSHLADAPNRCLEMS